MAVTKCPHCGEDCNFREVVVNKVEHIITELERVCNKCNDPIDYWAYGVWQSETKII